ncbi:response regulator [Paenibacillus sp. sgz500958]|uniref:response regulator n=1 Tax=Paenibacillus sp. sgz500958 TaxID=3242475 RepID=UPI0036D42861
MSIRVLIVEDDPMVAKFNRHYVEQVEGFEYAGWAASGDEAEELLRKDSVDLVLLDIYMQHTNGLKLLADIRESGSTVDVIIISAASDQASIRKALQFGAVDYLIKPFEFSRFQEALTAYREQYSMMSRREYLSQEELDKLVGHRRDDGPAPGPELPKGLTGKTLLTLWELIRNLPGNSFSTEEISAVAPISRISVRKYLAFLSDAGILAMDINYGAIGRPLYKYSITPEGPEIITKYL